ncbi:MAG TPA: sialidase family protein [Vicinamibacterales bacterium]
MLRTTCVVVFALAAVAAATPRAGAPAWPLRIESVQTPAAQNTANPQVTTSKRGLLLSWVEQRGTTATLMFAERAGGKWSEPRAAASGANWFVNWADVPSVLRLANGTLVAQWLQKSGASTYAYDVRLSYSTDEGKTWAPSFTPHDDGTPTEHGFVSMLPAGDGLGLLWLDGRATGGGEHASHGAGGAMTVRYAAYDRNWKKTADTPVDVRVCDCCPTAATLTADGPAVVYRDRSDKEVRDIAISRLENGKWTAGAPVNRDDWQIQACPVNGPAISARGKQVAVAWFTGVGDKPRAFAAFSSDGGRSFGAPVRLDDEMSLGRVDIELLPDGSAAAAYVEQTGLRAELKVRRIATDGTRSDAVKVADLANNRASGYPRMALDGDELIFAWTDREGGSQVRTATAKIPPR